MAASINGYFQIIFSDNKTYIRIYPASSKGQPVNVKEINEYLSFNKIEPTNSEYMIEISRASGVTDVLLCETVGFPINEYFKITFTPDKMIAIARFYPPSTGGSLLSAAEIVNDLKYKGIVVEPDSKVLAFHVKNRQYCYSYAIAKGKPPIEGRHASIEYFFNTNPNTKPTLNEDGSVDFFNLSTISKCAKGDILATLTPEVKGQNGMRVTGERVLPRDVKTLKLKYANNISLSEDGLSLIADVDGHVTLVDDKVFVSDVYEVVDVDTSTGNIDYAGNVLIKGNVKTGFKVKAEGNIEVRGVVEGAELNALGNVTIARGFNGMGRGVINARGSVVLKFVESGTINCIGNVTAEAIMHSNVTTEGTVEVTGKKGCIVGGSVRALGNVSAKTVGSEMGGDTIIDVGVDPSLKLKAQNLETAIKKAKEDIEKMVPVLTNFTKKIKEGKPLSIDQTRYFNDLSKQYKEANENFKKLNDDYDEAMDEIDGLPTDSCVMISGNVYPGTMITVSEVQKRITTLCAHSRFVKDGADVRIKPL